MPRKVQMMQMNVPQFGARITFGRTLLVPAGPAYHRIAFTEDLAHMLDCFAVRMSEERDGHLGALNLYQGPHFTTRRAACSHVDNRSGPASCQPAGTGASRLLSPSLSKQSQPWLNSLATVTLLWNGDLRLSGVLRRSKFPANPSPHPMNPRGGPLFVSPPRQGSPATPPTACPSSR